MVEVDRFSPRSPYSDRGCPASPLGDRLGQWGEAIGGVGKRGGSGRSGYGKPAVEYTKQAKGQPQEKPKPNLHKPFGQLQQDVNDVRVISEAQRKRFWTIARKSRFSDEGVKRLIYAWEFTSTNEITINAYEGLCEKAGDPDIAAIYNGSSAVSAS